MIRLRFFAGSASGSLAGERRWRKNKLSIKLRLELHANFFFALTRSLQTSRLRFQPMTVNEIFINQKGWLRSGWRFLIFLLAFLFFGRISRLNYQNHTFATGNGLQFRRFFVYHGQQFRIAGCCDPARLVVRKIPRRFAVSRTRRVVHKELVERFDSGISWRRVDADVCRCDHGWLRRSAIRF